MKTANWKKNRIPATIVINWDEKGNPLDLSPIFTEGLVLSPGYIGVHRYQKDRSSGKWSPKDGYVITHLASGAKVPSFGLRPNLGQAKRIAQRLSLLMDFSGSQAEIEKQGKANQDKVREIFVQETI